MMSGYVILIMLNAVTGTAWLATGLRLEHPAAIIVGLVQLCLALAIVVYIAGEM